MHEMPAKRDLPRDNGDPENMNAELLAAVEAYYSLEVPVIPFKMWKENGIYEKKNIGYWKKWEIEDYEKTVATTPEEVRQLGKAGWVKYDEMTANGTQMHFYRKRLYGDSAIFGSCPTRLEKLKNKKEQT